MSERKTRFVVDPATPTVEMTRSFDAPRRLVFKVLTHPDHIARWYGPHGYTVPSCEIALRVGGAYRIVSRDPQGNDYAFHGVYGEIVVPERIVSTLIFDPMPDKEAVVTQTFKEHGGKTTVTTTTVFQSIADRDEYLATGANEGAAESMDRVDTVLRTLL